MRKRPISQASNISKPRVSLTRDITRTRKKRSTLALEESHVLRHKLGRAWNNFFVNEDRRNENWKVKLECLEEQLAERGEKAADYLAKIEQQDQAIMNLRAMNDEKDALFQKQKVSLDEMEKRIQKLKGKVKDYKDHLNDATKEQQSIFKYFQPRYQDMKEQLKQSEIKHQSSLEEALSSSNLIRDKIQKSVQEVQSLSQHEIQKLNMEISSLHSRLADREKDIEREKDCVNDLRRELAVSHEISDQALKSLGTQNQELIQKSEEGALQIQNMEQSMNRQEKEVQSLLKLLENDERNMPDYSAFFESLKIHQAEILGS
ncbi:hypothetical protein ONZ43_g1321 [Nemania bipapillata]|uniref:Uncharacterized protein n=1 Tax=Nemania bipapillata TaxID=110536 RepID=A0ACC2J531_9PEZI|nr:hypothetical protein ONZ43_g1321 [Nemania bipapillata]